MTKKVFSQKIKYLANILTVSRSIAALAILQTEAVSPLFYALFLFCGITDILDGRIARRTGSESRTGAILDSIADMVFALICFAKLFPVMELPLFLWIWIGGIAAVRGINLIFGYICHRKLVMLHTKANKLTGLLLFLLPLFMGFFSISYIAFLICTIATFAAIQEGYIIRTSPIEKTKI